MKTIRIIDYYGNEEVRVFSSYREARQYLRYNYRHHELLRSYPKGGSIICELKPYHCYSFQSFRFDDSGNLVFSKILRYGPNSH